MSAVDVMDLDYSAIPTNTLVLLIEAIKIGNNY